MMPAACTSMQLFVGVDGKQRHDLDSPSFYNLAEVQQVVALCKSLVLEQLLRASQIGVIAAFRQQVLRLRTALRAEKLTDVNVGSVEDFQVNSSLACS